jgi:hypothetical protein
MLDPFLSSEQPIKKGGTRISPDAASTLLTAEP